MNFLHGALLRKNGTYIELIMQFEKPLIHFVADARSEFLQL